MTGCAAVAALVWLILDVDPENRVVAGVLVVVCAVVAVLLWRIRVRLSADAQGIVVVGPMSRRRIAWSEVDTVSTVRRGRFGLRSAIVEVEVRADGADDTELLAFGSFELGTDPAEVGQELLRLRAG